MRDHLVLGERRHPNKPTVAIISTSALASGGLSYALSMFYRRAFINAVFVSPLLSGLVFVVAWSALYKFLDNRFEAMQSALIEAQNQPQPQPQPHPQNQVDLEVAPAPQSDADAVRDADAIIQGDGAEDQSARIAELEDANAALKREVQDLQGGRDALQVANRDLEKEVQGLKGKKRTFEQEGLQGVVQGFQEGDADVERLIDENADLRQKNDNQVAMIQNLDLLNSKLEQDVKCISGLRKENARLNRAVNRKNYFPERIRRAIASSEDGARAYEKLRGLMYLNFFLKEIAVLLLARRMREVPPYKVGSENSVTVPKPVENLFEDMINSCGHELRIELLSLLGCEQITSSIVGVDGQEKGNIFVWNFGRRESGFRNNSVGDPYYEDRDLNDSSDAENREDNSVYLRFIFAELGLKIAVFDDILNKIKNKELRTIVSVRLYIKYLAAYLSKDKVSDDVGLNINAVNVPKEISALGSRLDENNGVQGVDNVIQELFSENGEVFEELCLTSDDGVNEDTYIMLIRQAVSNMEFVCRKLSDDERVKEIEGVFQGEFPGIIKEDDLVGPATAKNKRIQGLQTALNNSVSRLIEMNTRLVAANNELDALKAGKTTAQNGQTEAPAKQPWKSSSGRSMLDPAAPPSDASAPNGVGTEKHNAMLAARLAILGKKPAQDTSSPGEQGGSQLQR